MDQVNASTEIKKEIKEEIKKEIKEEIKTVQDEQMYVQDSHSKLSSSRSQELFQGTDVKIYPKQSAEIHPSIDFTELKNVTKIEKYEQKYVQDTKVKMEIHPSIDSTELKNEQKMKPEILDLSYIFEERSYYKLMNRVPNTSVSSKPIDTSKLKTEPRMFIKAYHPNYDNEFSKMETILNQLSVSQGSTETTQISKKQKTSIDEKYEGYPKMIGTELNGEYILGPNGTKIPCLEYRKVQWTTPEIATRKLLKILFSDEELATHSVSGKPSPAFHNRPGNRPEKSKLNPEVVEDIIACVLNKVGGSKQTIRATITTKCSDMTRKVKYRSLADKEKQRKLKEKSEKSNKMANDAANNSPQSDIE